MPHQSHCQPLTPVLLLPILILLPLLPTVSSVAIETEGSSPCRKELATGPYLKPTESTQHPQSLFLTVRSIQFPSSHLCLGLPSTLFPSGFPNKTLYLFLSSPITAIQRIHTEISSPPRTSLPKRRV